MQFSDYYKIERLPQDDWFDTILAIDTPLFVDPFLIYKDEKGPFKNSHTKIIAFFNCVFELLAKSGGKKASVHYQNAHAALRLPEFSEVCLGYTARGTTGSGTGRKSATLIAGAMLEAIDAGKTSLKHFEEIAILREGIGADRISDAVLGVLRQDFCKYSEKVCQRHGVRTRKLTYRRGTFNVQAGRWTPIEAHLPVNPVTDAPLVLVPQRYLGTLPTMSPEDFWNYCATNENEILRAEFNKDVIDNVSKADIVKLAKKRQDVVERYIAHAEKRRATPYSLSRDPRGLVSWVEPTKTYVAEHPLALHFTSAKEFARAVGDMVRSFQHFVENQGGWYLLWNDDKKPRREKASQMAFLGIVSHYCRANDIDLTREADVGSGVVDFKASKGYSKRILLEVKLAKNGRFWNGLEKQLPKYLESEQVRDGYFIVIVQTDKDLERVKLINVRMDAANKELGLRMLVKVVDARPTESASKL